MAKDLPGQLVMFPHLEPAHAACEAQAGGVQPQAVAALGLPNKPTCTVGEAFAHTGISKRQFRYYVEDGTLLAVNAARVPVGQVLGSRQGGERDRWRIVVRRTDAFKSEEFKLSFSLEEFICSRFNREIK